MYIFLWRGFQEKNIDIFVDVTNRTPHPQPQPQPYLPSLTPLQLSRDKNLEQEGVQVVVHLPWQTLIYNTVDRSTKALDQVRMNAGEMRACKVIAAHLPHATTDEAELLAITVLESWVDSTHEEVGEMLEDMLTSMVERTPSNPADAAEGIVEALSEIIVVGGGAGGGGEGVALVEGERCLLEMEDEWHAVEVVEAQTTGGLGDGTVQVRFIKYVATLSSAAVYM
jgi:hypothetical protein